MALSSRQQRKRTMQMMKSHWLRYGLGIAALLLVSVTLWRGYQPSQLSVLETLPAPVVPPAVTTVLPAPVAKLKPATAVVRTPTAGMERSITEPAPFADFNAWAEKFAANPVATAIAEGEILVKGRYQEMLQLARHDPKLALANALPYRLRKAIPASFAQYLEQPVSGRGDFKVIECWAAPGQSESELPPTEYRVTLKKITYQAYTYGARVHQMSRKHIALHGVALTDEHGLKIMALGGDSLRRVDPVEAKDLMVAGKLSSSAACPVCGAVTADATQASVAEMGTEYLCFDSEVHLATYNNQLNQALTKYWPSAASSSEASVPAQTASATDDSNVLFPQLVAQGHTGGRKGNMKLLYMPVLFADDPIPAQTQDGAQATCANVAKVYKENSYGSVNWETDVTPLLQLPQRKAAYADGIAGGTPVSVLGDALAIARSLGYSGPYDDRYVVFNSLNPVVTFGGRSDGLINGSPGAMPHELGHSTFGWTHANYLDLSGTNPGAPNDGNGVDPDSLLGHDDVNAPVPVPIGKPQMVVYGDPYDIMGGGGSHFGVIFKNQVNWLTDERVRFINSNQTNRIYAFDVPQIFPERLYALRMHKDFDRQYWLSYRQSFPDNPWLSHGVIVQWQSVSAGNNELLVDTTYTSYNRKNDCAVTIGRTFSDPPAHIFITPVAQGGDTGTNKWIDVVVNIGPFPDNNTPSVSLAANSLRVNPGDVVTFTATAQDPDGDTLAYNWDFSDMTLGPNAPVTTKSWAAAGQYVVRCEVSDMKGGMASAYVVVVVGTPTSFTISGRVLDQDGNPLQGVRVHNGAALPANPPIPQEGANASTTPVTPTTYRSSFTDSQGFYTIGNIPPGNYNCRAFLYGYHTVAQFADPVDITAASASGLDFVATALPRVTVEKVTDAPENGIPGDGTTNSGIFRITRDGGDLSQPLAVRYRMDGTAAMNTNYLLWPENLWTNVTRLPNGNKITNVAMAVYGRTVIPAWQFSVDMAVTAFDNNVGNGNQSAIMTLVLQTNDYRAVPYLTNVIYTNYISSNSTYYLTTNTELHTNIYTVNIPGWELLPYGPSDTPTWFQTDPTYVIANAEATVWILDDDLPNLPIVAVVAVGDVASETYNDHGMFMFTRNNAPMTNALTIYFTVSGTASNGVDYVALPDHVTIPANESFVLLPVEALNDLFVEGDEYVSVTVTSDPAYAGGGASATVTILDDDLPNVITYASDSVASKVGGNHGTVTVARSGDLGQPLVVNYLVSGTAISGRDYQPLPQQITIPAGSITADIVITPISNAITGARTVVIQLADSQSYTIDFQNSATVTIQDAVPTVTLTSGGNAAEGGASTTFTVTRDGATTSNLLVYFSVGGSAVEISDYSAVGTNITIPAGSATATIQINTMNDLFREYGDMFGDETVIIQLQPGSNYNVGNPNSGTVRITDNDSSGLPEIGFMLKESTVREDAGMVYLLVKCSANPTTDHTINFEFHQSSGNAVENVNYRLGLWCGTNMPLVGMVPGGFVTNLVPIPYVGVFGHFTPPSPAGDFTHPEDTIGYIPLTILNDNLAAGNRTLTVRLFPPTGYVTNFDVNTNVVTVTNGGSTALVTNTTTNVYVTHLKTNAFIGDYLTHTITIQDVGVTTVGVSADVPVAYEAGLQPGLFVISRAGPLDRPLTVSYAVTGDAAPGNDYVRMTTNGRLATVTIPAGTNRVLLPVVPLDNPTEELPRSVVLTILDGTNYQTSYLASDTVTIYSDDGTIQFLARQFEFSENVGWVHIPVVRSGDTNRAAAVDYQFIPGTARPTNDYLGMAGTLSFAPGETDKDILVQIVDNNVVEPDKTFTIQLQNPTGGVPLGGQNVASIVILNDDTSIQFATNTFTVNENGGNALITVTRIGLLTNAASAVFTTVDGSAANGLDYTNVSVRVDFAPGETNQMVSVPILDDALFEGDETVGLILSDPSPGIYLGPIPAATLVILDDECTVTFTTNNFVVWEYAPYAEVTVKRLGGTVNPLSVDFHTTDGSATGVSNLDYYSVTTNLFFRGNEWIVSTNGSGQLEYHPGESSKTVLVPLHDDTLGEGNEYFNVILDNVQTLAPASVGATLLGPVSNSIVTILDNETPGNVDYEYQQPTLSNPSPGPNGPVYGLALQTDGMTVLGGAFTQVDGKVYNRIARMQAMGVVDSAFNPGYGANDDIFAVAMTPDNKIVVGGAFTRMDTSNHAGITRLRANGDVDPSFNPATGVSNGVVRALAIQSDGRIILGGDFTAVGNWVRGRLARLNTNGAVDLTFGAAADGPVFALAIQPDGNVLIGGLFTNVNGTVRRGLARVNTNGVVDSSFNAGLNLVGPIYSLALLADGRILVAGAFSNAVATNLNYLVRLFPDGSIDPSFYPTSGPDGPVNAVAVQANGRILIGGGFSSYNGTPLSHFGRVRSSGSEDFLFNVGSGANDVVRALVVQPDTEVIIGGDFTVVNEISRHYLARIHGDEKRSVAEVEFAATVFRVSENQGPAQIIIQRSGNTNQALTVDFATSDGTASNGFDYAGYTNTVSFAAGEESKTNWITIIDDALVEGNETVNLKLLNPSANVDLSGYDTAVLVIEDDEKSVRFVQETYDVRENATNAVIQVLREGSLVGTVSVKLSTTPGTATAGSDYTSVTTNIVFQENQTNAYVYVPVTLDALEEIVETVFLTLSNPVGCFLGSPSNATLRILDSSITAGAPDPNFDPGEGAGGPGRQVRALALAPNAMILAGGVFTNFNGVTNAYVTRFGLNGLPDTNFNTGTGPNGMVAAVAALDNGRSVIGGAFTSVNGLAYNYLGRLLTTGSADSTFSLNNQLNASLMALAVQGDGKIVVAGAFTQPSSYLGRFKANGGADAQFNLGTGPNGIVYAVALGSSAVDSPIVIGGVFGTVNGYARSKVARLTSTGAVDEAFVPPVMNLNGIVYAVAVDSAGRVLVGGSFTNIGGTNHKGLARLSVDGSLDLGFNPTVEGTVYSIVVQPNGRVLIGGSFTMVNQTNRGSYARLFDDGTLDASFASGTGANGTVYSVLFLPDNSIMIGGSFSTVDGVPRKAVARLVGDPSPLLRLSIAPGSAGQWQFAANTQPGAIYQLSASLDLLNWTDVGPAITAADFYTQFSDPGASAFAFRFYRVNRLSP